jgi:AraC family transcriptional regulator
MFTTSDTTYAEPHAYRKSPAPPLSELPPPTGASPRADRGNPRRVCNTMPANTDPVVEVSPAEAVSRRGLSWPGMAGEIVRANRRGRIHFHFCARVHLLAIYECSVREEGETFVQGLPRSTLRDCGRKLVFVPAGHEFLDWHEPRTMPCVTFFYFDPDQLESGPELGLPRPSLMPRLFFQDGAVWHTAAKLRSLIDGGETDPMYMEALGTVLAHELMRPTTCPRAAVLLPYGCLAAWQRRKACDYIEEHLAEPISLATLAQLVRLSPNYFCRAFSHSLGMPPQRYHTARRIERAKVLLAKRGASVTDVGFSVGYSETSAFSAAFRRVTGLTPSSYRRSLS